MRREVPCEDFASHEGASIERHVPVAGRPQVLSTGDWAAQMCLSQHDIGTGMDDDEVEDLSRRVDIEAVRAYRSAIP